MNIRVVICVECGGWVEEFLEHHRHKHHLHRKHLTRAKHLKQRFIFHRKDGNMNIYHLSWTPGVGVKQDIIGILPDKTEKVLAAALGATDSSTDVTFADNEQVEWLVRTTAADGKTTLDSDHNSFTATDQTPASAATNLNATFVSHTP